MTVDQEIRIRTVVAVRERLVELGYDEDYFSRDVIEDIMEAVLIDSRIYCIDYSAYMRRLIQISQKKNVILNF